MEEVAPEMGHEGMERWEIEFGYVKLGWKWFFV